MSSASKGRYMDDEPTKKAARMIMEEEDIVDFQLLIEFNRNTCWGLYEQLVRGQNQLQTFLSSIQLKKVQHQIQ